MTPLIQNEIAALAYIIHNARKHDRQELYAIVDMELLLSNLDGFWASAVFKYMVLDKTGRPGAFICFHQTSPVTLTVSMIATDNWSQCAKRVIRWGLKFFKPQALEMGYRRVECRTISGNEHAITFLEGLGFTLEAEVKDYGRGAEVFWQYAWRLSDHVHLLSPEAAQNSGTA